MCSLQARLQRAFFLPLSFLLLPLCSLAQEVVPQDPTAFGSEVTITPFAAGSFTGDSSAMGGGVGLDYFFTDKVGVGANYAVFAFDDEVHTVTADLALRYPISKAGLSPYLLLGGGLSTDGTDTNGLYRLGGGMEVRLLNSQMGIFADGVHNWVANDEDFTIARLGVRLPY
ncbi:MAG: hypothetical protein AAF191_18085 [Verrucomicrobiota bacterium]